MNTSLRQLLIDQFEQPSLTEQQFRQLEAIQLPTQQQSIAEGPICEQPTHKQEERSPFHGRLRAIAICVLALVSIGLLLNNQFYRLPGTEPHKIARSIPIQTARDIAREVVNNHLHMKPLDLQSDSHAQVQAFFSMLDFSPVESSYYTKSDRVMLGGRYCSIKGITAAQLRFKSNRGKLETLYQVPYNTKIFSGLSDLETQEQPLVLYERGLKVSLWIEKGLLMVSAQAAD